MNYKAYEHYYCEVEGKVNILEFTEQILFILSRQLFHYLNLLYNGGLNVWGILFQSNCMCKSKSNCVEKNFFFSITSYQNMHILM